jgi:16S rRNA (cytosine1402-N4)-methyltransferase
MDHAPVLLERVRDLFAPALEAGGLILDATLGRAGHSLLLLEDFPSARLLGIDRDPDALEASRAVLASHADRVTLVRAGYAEIASVLERLGSPPLRGVLFDLGVSSPQLDEAHRGFSFRNDGPLDMRMDPSTPITAHNVVNDYEVRDLERVIRTYGEERFARRVARAIVEHRPIERTGELADVVKEAIPAATRRTGGHPARRTFQALRMEVNDELEQLRRSLPAAVDALEPGGRIVVLAYHSLEDRIVKKAFQERVGACTCPPGLPVCVCGAQASLRLLNRRPETASEEEISVNPRAKSVKLRAAEKLEVGGEAA